MQISIYMETILYVSTLCHYLWAMVNFHVQADTLVSKLTIRTYDGRVIGHKNTPVYMMASQIHFLYVSYAEHFLDVLMI